MQPSRICQVVAATTLAACLLAPPARASDEAAARAEAAAARAEAAADRTEAAADRVEQAIERLERILDALATRAADDPPAARP